MSKDNKDVLQFLDSLDQIPNAPAGSAASKPAPGHTTSASASTGEAAEALAFLDELTQQSSRPTRVMTPGPRVRNAPDRKSGTASPAPAQAHGATTANPLVVSGNNITPATSGLLASEASEANPVANSIQPIASSGGWGWGSVWNTASAALAQAKTVVDEQVKQLPNEQAKKWGGAALDYVKTAQLDKISNDLRTVGMSTLTQMINAVAPPIAEHEVIQIWLSHDMKGYEGVESLVYRSLARVMEQVDGGDLVVNRGHSSKPKSTLKQDSKERDLGAIDGLEPAYKLAIVELEDLVKSDILNATKKPGVSDVTANTSNPTTYSSVFLRIQPFYSITPPFMTHSTKPKMDEGSEKQEDTPAPPAGPSRQLQFFLYLTDPNHSITHSTISQVIPAEWIDMWDEYEWVEDEVVDSLRVAVEVVGQLYLASRMNWVKKASKHKQTASTSTITGAPPIKGPTEA